MDFLDISTRNQNPCGYLTDLTTGYHGLKSLPPGGGYQILTLYGKIPHARLTFALLLILSEQDWQLTIPVRAFSLQQTIHKPILRAFSLLRL